MGEAYNWVVSICFKKQILQSSFVWGKAWKSWQHKVECRQLLPASLLGLCESESKKRRKVSPLDPDKLHLNHPDLYISKLGKTPSYGAEKKRKNKEVLSFVDVFHSSTSFVCRRHLSRAFGPFRPGLDHVQSGDRTRLHVARGGRIGRRNPRGWGEAGSLQKSVAGSSSSHCHHPGGSQHCTWSWYIFCCILLLLFSACIGKQVQRICHQHLCCPLAGHHCTDNGRVDLVLHMGHDNDPACT